MLSTEALVLDALDELERLQPHRAAIDGLRARRGAAGLHAVPDAELLDMIEHGVGDPGD